MSKKYDSSSMGYWIIGFVTIAVFGLIGFLILKPQVSVSSKTNHELALSCTTDMATQFHIHPHLEIVVDSQKQEIPARIGIRPTCMNSLHTHDNIGTLHVESPEKRDFTLADFFAVWGKIYNQNQILDYKTDATHTIRETVNGRDVQDYENTVLRDGDEIIIYYEQRK